MKLKTIKQVINHQLCIGCGLCSIDENVQMEVSEGMILPNKVTNNTKIESSCPSKGYNLKELGLSCFGEINFCPEIGYYRSLRLAHTLRSTFLQNASSGGIMTEIAATLLSKGLVDGVISTKFTYVNNIVRTESYIARTEEDLIDGQGSKYCPTSTLSFLKNLEPNEKYLLIGTPCQIAGFRLYSQHSQRLKSQIPYTIANFCGGYRDFNELDYFISNIAHIEDVKYFRHRGGGQPGSMKIEGEKGKIFQYPYPDYAKLSPFVKNERCTLCMDATGELADFSCGDAWLEERDKTAPWSIVIARSKFAEDFLNELASEQKIKCGGNITEEQVVKSQKLNITSKKYRQYKRIKVRDFMLLFSPEWSDNFPVKGGTYLSEIKIILSKAKAKLFKH